MKWLLPAICADVPLDPVSADNVTNHFELTGDGMIRDQGYNNATGQPGAIQAFLTSGLMPITAAMRSGGFALSLDGSAPNWQINQARCNFYTADTASGNFNSSVTSGVTLASDARSMTVASGSIPAAGTHFGTNYKWTQGIPSLVYTVDNVIPTDAEVDLETAIMVNSGTTAVCLTEPGAADTDESISTAPTLATGEFIVAHQGYSTFIRKPWTSGKHMVSLVTYAPETHDYNNCLQFRSVVEIASTVPGPSTPGAWVANYSVTGANATTYAVWSDNHPAYKCNDMFLGGAHGVTSSLVTASAPHGLANTNRGALVAVDGGTQYRLTQVYDTTRCFITALNTGTATTWAINGTVITSGTVSWVSGGVSFSNFSISSGVTAYLMPGTEILKNKVWLEGARALTDNGVFTAVLRIQDFSYRVPNSASVLTYVAANVGSASDLNYNHSSITKQLQIDLRWIDDAWATTVYHQVTALQDHTCSFAWPMQFGKVNAYSGATETLWFIAPATISNTAATTGSPGTHNNGSALNFSSWQNIGSNAKEYYWDSVTWAASTFWSDSTQRPPWLYAYGVKNSGGTFIRKFVMACSRIVGWTADGTPDFSGFLSGANKFYAVTRYDEAITSGDARMNVAGFGWVDPALDTSADISFALPLGGGAYEWNWWATGAVTGYTVPLPTAVSGKQFTVICRSAGCTVTVNANRTITVTTTGQGQGFVALAY